MRVGVRIRQGVRFRTPLVLVFVCSLPETFHSQRQTLPLTELLFQPKSHELPDGILITVDAKHFRCAGFEVQI